MLLLRGRQILHAVLIANKTIDSLLKHNENGVLCKLKLEKAYDHLNMKFLISVMQKMGFRKDGQIGFGGVFRQPDSQFWSMVFF